MGDVVVGTCSWTDKTMIERWYPRGVSSAEARLRYYAARFDTVEVDSTFYGLPQRAHAENWVLRTPPEFTFHVKAYGLMTQHEVDERALHPDLRGFSHQITDRSRVRDPEPAMVEASFEIFLRELEPLRESGKMGGVLMQFPPYFAATYEHRLHEHLDYLEYAQEQLDGLHMLVEFRHPSWVKGDQLAQTMRFLGDRGMTYVCVDAPQFAHRETMPPVTAVTSAWAYVRFHGRNRDTYFGRTASAADRFDYLYTAEELAEWDEPVRELAGEADHTWAMFNNCRYDYAPRNAREMAEILGDVVGERASGTPSGVPAEETAGAPGEGEGASAGHDDTGEQLGFGI
ncbi:MAG: DUF72 domain-containing protein [Actinomycetota bacterium]|nr:DUF72 domain-containing protein [Actinomycetota bacterium]